ncbi:MAG TPA: hypothetical protein VLR94_06615, partial [Acidobacteriota bacterium]|nr:hypothetical protein [Acidobacteriota bacterium]
FAFHVLWILWLILGICFRPSWFLAVFLLVQTVQSIKSNLRLECARAVVPENAGRRVVFWVMSPLVGIANFFLTAGNLLTRRVRWRGVEYEVLGPNKLRRV